MTCEFCDDGDGHCVFPYYGVAPHVHERPEKVSESNGVAQWIGTTRTLPKEQWGDNFREDQDCPGCGVYLRCEKCGDGEPAMVQP